MSLVDTTGIHYLSRNGMVQPSVRLVTGDLALAINVVSVSSLVAGFGLSLSHYSQDQGSGPLGHKWRHNHQAKIIVGASLVTVITGGGQNYDYIPNGSGGWMLDTSTSLYQSAELSNPTGTLWELKTKPDEWIWRFDATALVGYPDTAGRLLEMEDRQGNVLTFNYTSGKLTSIEEPQGREIVLGYTGDLITSVTDPLLETTLLTYDAFENLVSVSGPEGCTATLEYAQQEDHRVTAITDARGKTTRYAYEGQRLSNVILPDGEMIAYTYLVGADAPLEWIGQFNTLPFAATLITFPNSVVYEYRFDPMGNLWRTIAPSGHSQRFFWNDLSKLLYASEGYQLKLNGYHGPSDNFNNKHTRYTVNERGDTIAKFDATGIGNTFEYDSDGRLLVAHLGQVNQGIQGAWEGHYGTEGIILCGFNTDTSDVYRAPTYVSSTLGTAITNGNGSGGNTFARANFDTLDVIDPRAPVLGDGSNRSAIGHWKQSGALATGAVFQFAINLTTSKAFNLSLYSHSADHTKDAYIEMSYREQFGRDIEFEVTDIHGTQKYRTHNNAPGIWATFPVEGDSSNPIQVTIRATGANNQPVVSAVAFDPYHDRRTFYEYTGGNLTKVRDGLGNETTRVYNADGTLATITDARNKTTTFSYLDAYKNLTKITDADSNETLLVYDANGNVTSTTDANLHVTSMTYDGKNRLLTVTDPLLNVRTLDYDGNGNVISITDAKNRETLFTYNSLNQLITVENALGHIVRTSYDEMGRVATQTNPRGFVTRYAYDSDGNLTSVEAPDGERSSMSYDFLNRLVALTGPNGNQERMELVNLVGARNLFLNPSLENASPKSSAGVAHWRQGTTPFAKDTAEHRSGNTSIPLSLSEYSWTHNKMHLPEGAKFVAQVHAKRDQQELILKAEMRDFSAQTVSTQNSEPFDEKFEDWAASEPLLFTIPSDAQTTPSNPTLVSFSAQVTIANNKLGWLDDMELFMLSMAYRYDKQGRLKTVMTPDGARVYTHRDRLGRPVAAEDPRGLRTTMVYDSLDRVASISKPNGETFEFAYNEVGALVSFKDGLDQATLYTYDDLNRLTTITYPDTTTEEFTYDAVGNMLTYTDNAAQIKSYAYDDANRLETITFPDSTTISMTYDEVGNLLTLTERNGDVTEFDHDDLNRVTTVTRTRDLSNSTPEWELHYAYDVNGNLTSVSDGVAELWRLGSLGALYGTAQYGSSRYSGALDAMDRPLGVAKGATVHAEFRYDHEGRRTGVDFANGASTDVSFDIVGRPLALQTANQGGSLLSTTYRYDEASNRIGHVTGSDTFDYRIDEDGKLVGECVNRIVLDGAREFAKSTLEGLLLGDTLELLPLDDDFSGEELDCDRWRVAYIATGTDDDSIFLGAETRQDNGLHMRFPRGYSNRIRGRDLAHPLKDKYGAINVPLFSAIEHRVPITGDFDIRVDLADFKGAGGLDISAGLRISSQPFELYSNYAQLELTAGGLARLWGNVPLSTMSAPTIPTILRLVRSGTTLTAYVWNNGTSAWVSQAGWVKVFNNLPMWISLVTYTWQQNAVAATFKNLVYNASTAPSRASSGTFTSQVYDAGRNVAWHNLSWQETLPASTNLEFQVSFSDDPEGPWSYIGPDGTSSTRFTTPAGESVGPSKISRYCKLKGYFTGNGSATPILDSVELSYSGSVTSQYRSFSFDDAGNVTGANVRTDISNVEEIRTYDDLNQIVDNEIDDGTTLTTWTYTHDNNGNLTSKTDGTDTYTYLWDDQNRLVGVELNSVAVVSYEYDSKSRLLQRIEGGTTTNYHWNGWSLIREEKTGAVTETTNYLVPVGAFERGGDWFYLHGDALSSTQLVTDENGAQIGRFIYGAWGQELYASESVPGVLENRFVGGLGCRRDAATGLIYMRHRWYDPDLMRFISRDPIGTRGGANLYKYSANNPVSNVDPNGLTPGGPYHSGTQADGVNVYWNNDPADANLRVKAPVPPQRIVEQPVVSSEAPWEPSTRGNIGPQYYEPDPPKVTPANPLVTPKNQQTVDKCITFAEGNSKDVAWLAAMMGGRWNYADPALKMSIWGAASAAAGLTKDDLYKYPGIYFTDDELVYFEQGRQYYNNYNAQPSSYVQTVEGTIVERVFDIIAPIFGY